MKSDCCSGKLRAVKLHLLDKASPHFCCLNFYLTKIFSHSSILISQVQLTRDRTVQVALTFKDKHSPKP